MDNKNFTEKDIENMLVRAELLRIKNLSKFNNEIARSIWRDIEEI